MLDAVDLKKKYDDGRRIIEVLRGTSLHVGKGETTAIIGQSGVGKSTLLNLLGALDRPDGGSVKVDDEDLFALPEKRLAELRNSAIGFVFQFHHLLGDFDALENVMMPLLVGGESRATARSRALDMLESVDLVDRTTHRPGELSGGEQQRVAVARALVTEPSVVLADEPTGNLDPESADRIYRLLLNAQAKVGCAMVVATHSVSLASLMDRTLRLKDGLLVEEETG